MTGLSLRTITRPACLLYFATCSLGVICGMWPAALYVPPGGADPSTGPLPVLSFLAVFQSLFFMLVYPVVVMRREKESSWLNVIEMCVMSLVTIPLYYLSSVFSDASFIDIAKVWLVVIATFPLGHGAGCLFRHRTLGSVALSGVLMLVFGLPLIYYILIEFCPGIPDASVVADCSPVLFLWAAGQSHIGDCPLPVWPPLVWAVTGMVVLLWSREPDSVI